MTSIGASSSYRGLYIFMRKQARTPSSCSSPPLVYIFTIGVAFVGFIGLLLLLKKTSFGRSIRAFGDDEEVSKVVGGEVYWRQKLLSAATHAIVKEGISFVPQGRRVFTHLTIQENLEMGCLYLNNKTEKERRMDAVMELFPILHQKRRDLASQMSGGQQQMLALGRGLMAGPEMLLLDEPTLGLAPIVVKEVFQKVSEINERLRTTIFVVEHNIKGVLAIVDRAYVLDKGRVVNDGTPQSVRETAILTEVFLGRINPG